MSWNYNCDPENPIDRMRELIADTNEQRQLISDERLKYYMEQNGNEHFAAEEACMFIANDAAAHGDYELEEEFKQRAKELHQKGLLHVAPVIIRSDEEPRFSRDTFKNK